MGFWGSSCLHLNHHVTNTCCFLSVLGSEFRFSHLPNKFNWAISPALILLFSVDLSVLRVLSRSPRVALWVAERNSPPQDFPSEREAQSRQPGRQLVAIIGVWATLMGSQASPLDIVGSCPVQHPLVVFWACHPCPAKLLPEAVQGLHSVCGSGLGGTQDYPSGNFAWGDKTKTTTTKLSSQQLNKFNKFLWFLETKQPQTKQLLCLGIPTGSANLPPALRFRLLPSQSPYPAGEHTPLLQVFNLDPFYQRPCAFCFAGGTA